MARSACLTVALALVQVSLVLCALPSDYESKTATAKRDILWSRMTEGGLYEDGTYPTSALPLTTELQALIPTFVKTAFTRVSDEMETGRSKIFHTYGTCAKAKIVSLPGHNYTGIFASGKTTIGIFRPSLGKYYETKLLPGGGFKCLIDGQPSVNFHTLFSLDGQEDGDYNFFKNNVSNWIPDATTLKLKAATQVFQTALYLLGFASNRPENPNTMTLYEHSAIHHNGSAVEGKRVAPWRIDFVPTAAVQQDPAVKEDFRKKIASIPSGTIVYNLVAYSNPKDGLAQLNGQIIAQLITESAFVASQYCDQTLYMKHNVKRWRKED